MEVRGQALVLCLRNPAKVLNVIPHAQLIGGNHVVLPHRFEETRVLRNLGIRAPAPIEHQYNWPGRYAPMEGQRRMAAFLSMNQRAYNLSDMGTGKTLGTLWAADYLMRRKLVRRALVVAPLSTLVNVWGSEIYTSFMHRTHAILHAPKAEHRRKLLEQDHDFYIINFDGVKILQDDLLARDDIDLVIVDELATYRNTTERWKALNAIVNHKGGQPRVPWVWGLTGTPTPQEPADAWGQCRLVLPSSVPQYKKRFRDLVMRQMSTYKWAPKDDATDTVHRAMQPSIRVTREELPPTMWTSRHVELEPEQAAAYATMLAKLKAEFDTGAVTALNEAIKISKLIQIACGVVYGSDEEKFALPITKRLSVVKEIIEQAGGKVIVFVPFTGALRRLKEELAKEYTVELVDGSVPPGERSRIFNAFQSMQHPRVLVAQQAAMSHGVTLTAADTIVWYAPPNSHEQFDQANHRIIRTGQKRSQLIVMLEGTAAERKRYASLQNKQRVQESLLELFEAEAMS